MTRKCYRSSPVRLSIVLLFFLLEPYVNGFSSCLAPIVVTTHHSRKALQNSHRSLSSVVVVNAARRRRADDTNTTNTTDTTANPTLRGTRRKHFGQKLRTWMQNYEALLEFKRLKQHCRVPARYSHDPTLGTWVWVQRANRDSLSLEQLELLDEAGFDWETKEERNNRLWQENYQKLIEYKEVYGDCCVPTKYKDDKALGLWVYSQRQLRNQGRLQLNREEQLEAIGFTWSLKDAKENNNTTYMDSRWDEKYDRLLEFRGKWGHCLVPKNFDEDISLGSWVNTQRSLFKTGRLRPDRKNRLEEVGFEFDPSNADRNLDARHWDLMFQHLVDYKAKHGDTNVKQRHEEFGLGKWVQTQRQMKSTMDEHRRKKLENIGFMWTSPRPDTWQERLEELRDYMSLHGTCSVKTKENPRLARWVYIQRYKIKTGKLSEWKVKQLESIGFD